MVSSIGVKSGGIDGLCMTGQRNQLPTLGDYLPVVLRLRLGSGKYKCPCHFLCHSETLATFPPPHLVAISTWSLRPEIALPTIFSAAPQP